MSDTMNLNVRISGSLKEFVSHEIQEGAYENVSEYIRDLIRRDKVQAEEKAFNLLKAELKLAFDAPESDYIELTLSDISDKPAVK